MVTLRVKNKFRPWMISDLPPTIRVPDGGGTFMPGMREALIRHQRGILTEEGLLELREGIKYTIFNCTCGILFACLDKLTENTCFGIRYCKRGELIIQLTCCWVLSMQLGLRGIYGIGGCGSELGRRLAGKSCYSGIICYLCNSLWEGHVFWFFSLLMSWGRK